MEPENTQFLLDDPSGIARATGLLRAGKLVAFATETVYGLGADACSDAAVAGIYAAKSRPTFNPLIVHVSEQKIAQRYVEWSDTADQLARAFWPGPLTLVLPMKANAGISPLVSAGLDSLAIRVPAHPSAQALLRAFDGPLAAPSANPSGRISPTSADHVMDGLAGRISAVLDGGDSAVGVESTILELSSPLKLLRPGGIPIERIEDCVGYSVGRLHHVDKITAPGQLVSHYAPEASVRLNATVWQQGEVRLGFGAVECDLNLSASQDLTEAAANLFRHLRALDQGKPIAISPIPERGLGQAINDRLRRAAAPRDG